MKIYVGWKGDGKNTRKSCTLRTKELRKNKVSIMKEYEMEPEVMEVGVEWTIKQLKDNKAPG